MTGADSYLHLAYFGLTCNFYNQPREQQKDCDNISFDQTTEDLTDTEKEILLSQVKGQTTDKKKDKKGFVN